MKTLLKIIFVKNGSSLTMHILEQAEKLRGQGILLVGSQCCPITIRSDITPELRTNALYLRGCSYGDDYNACTLVLDHKISVDNYIASSLRSLDKLCKNYSFATNSQTAEKQYVKEDGRVTNFSFDFGELGRLSIEFVKHERGLSMQVLEQSDMFRTAGQLFASDFFAISAGDSPDIYRDVLFIRGTKRSMDFIVRSATFLETNQDRDDYLSRVLYWLTAFAESIRAKVTKQKVKTSINNIGEDIVVFKAEMGE